MRIDKNFHISFTFENAEGNEACIYIDFIDKRRFDVASSFLGEVYSLIKGSDLHPDVLVKDWPTLLEKHKENIDAFIEHIFNTSEIVSEGKLIKLLQSKKKLESELQEAFIDEDVLTQIKGLILFIFALLRYTTVSSLKSVKGLFTMWQDASTWRNSQKIFMKDSQDLPPTQEKEELEL